MKTRALGHEHVLEEDVGLGDAAAGDRVVEALLELAVVGGVPRLDDRDARRVLRDGEGDRVVRVLAPQPRRRHDEDLVGRGRSADHDLGAAHDDAVLAALDDAQVHVRVGLLATGDSRRWPLGSVSAPASVMSRSCASTSHVFRRS